MGLNAFHRLDIVAEDPNDPAARKRFIAVNARGWPADDEARLTLQAILKFTSYERYAASLADEGGSAGLELLSAGPIPDTLLRWLGDRGVDCKQLDTEDRAPSVGRPAGFPDDGHGRPALGPLIEAAARRFAAEQELDWPPTQLSLVLLDDVLDARRKEAGLDAEEASEEMDDGDLVVLAGSYAGECARGAFGGEWQYDPGQATPLALAITTERGETIKVNFHGKVDKFLRNGRGDSVEGLLVALSSHIRGA